MAIYSMKRMAIYSMKRIKEIFDNQMQMQDF